MKKDIVFIIGPPKAGTTLLLSLLDSHPDIFTYPYQFKFHDFFERSQGGSNISNLTELNRLFLNESKLRFLKDTDTTKLERPEFRYDTGLYNHEEFRDKFNLEILEESLRDTDMTTPTRSDYFLHLAKAIANSQGKPWPELKYVVEKPGYFGIKHIRAIRKDFPEAKIICVIRDPRDILASRKAVEKKIKGYCLFSRLITGVRQAFDLSVQLKDDPLFYILRYENLVRDSKQTMTELASWLQIDFNTTFLQPTFSSVPWRGNSSTDEPLQNISGSRIGKHEHSFSAPESIAIHESFAGTATALGYEGYKRPSRFQSALTKLRMIPEPLKPYTHRIIKKLSKPS